MDSSISGTEPSLPERAKLSDGKLTTRIIAAGGLMALTGGFLLAFGPPNSTTISWIARRLGEMGISAGIVIGSGVLCSAIAAVSYRINRMAQQLRAAEDAVLCTETLGAGMRQLVARVTRMHAEEAEVKEGIRGLLQLAQEQTSAKVAGMQVDATFKLAASMDQMRMRLEDRMQAQESTIDSRLMDLFGSLEATQEEVRHLLAQQEAQLKKTLEAVEIFDTASSEIHLDLESAPLLPGEPDEGELEVFVDLDEEPEDDPSAEECDPSKFDWDSIEVGPTIEGLGLLDELDDEGVPLTEDPLLEEAPSLLTGNDRDHEGNLFSEEDLQRAWQDFKRRRDG